MRPGARLTLALGLLAALAGLFVFTHNEPRREDRADSTDQPVTGPTHPNAATGLSAGASPSKSRPRSATPKMTKARTLALLETPIPGPVEFPEQTVLERIEAINVWLEESGVPREELCIFFEPASAQLLIVKELHCRDFSATHLSPRLLLGALFDVSALRYRVVNGGVEIHYISL